MTAETVRYTDSGDTSGKEQLSARWSDLHPDIPLARYPVHALADMLALFLPVVLAVADDRLSLGADMLALLAAAAVIALAVGLVSALVWAGVAALLLWFLDMPWDDALTIAGAGDAAALVLLTVVALAVSFLGFRAADESLDQLARLAASLLDMSRLQAGKLSVFPRPAVLGDIVAHALDDVGPRSIAVRVPAGLPEVMADPALMERVIVNLARNALRYSPPGTPPQLAARARGGRVELRVIDRGPGIPRTERDRAFLPFQRLGDTGTSPGVGLGLALSRGLTEAMGGTLNPRETPGGGLTMVISLPVAGSTARPAITDKLLAAIGAGTGSGDGRC